MKENIEEKELQSDIVIRLLTWYDENKRVLPWRENKDPYRIWISEIMLQQTRVEAVKPYFERFIKELPDVKALAAAPEEKLLKLWEGLGYYNRVKNMQKAAIQIMGEFGGEMPSEYELLLSLPGIGAYTAGAVASIAFDRSVVAVDGNVLRIISRLTADESDVLSESYKKMVKEKLTKILPTQRSGDFNQALMELGATVCLPNGAPKCDICPWQEMCLAKKRKLLDKIPYKKKKKARTIEEKTVLILRDGEKILLHKRPKNGLLAGMYEFPMFDGYLSKDEIVARAEKMGYEVLYHKRLPDAVHVFSHKEWHMQGYLLRIAEVSYKEILQPETEGCLFVASDIIEEKYPIPSAFRAYTPYANVALGKEHFLR